MARVFAVQALTNDFAFSLVRASQAMGSLLEVARLLDVEPKQVYSWIAGVDYPSDADRPGLERQLRSLLKSATAF